MQVISVVFASRRSSILWKVYATFEKNKKTLPFHPKGAEATLETNGRTDKRVGRTFQRTPSSGTGVFCPCDEAQLEGRLRDLDDEISEMRSSRDEVRRDTELQHGILRNQAADLRKRHEQAEDRAQEHGRKVVPNYSGFVRNPVKRLEQELHERGLEVERILMSHKLELEQRLTCEIVLQLKGGKEKGMCPVVA